MDSRKRTQHDVRIGLKIKRRRTEIGMSQSKLAEMIGLTFQQVQKYEHATNRITASRLVDVAKALQTTPAWFFEEDLPHEAAINAAMDRELLDVMKIYAASPPDVRKLMCALVRCLPESKLNG